MYIRVSKLLWRVDLDYPHDQWAESIAELLRQDYIRAYVYVTNSFVDQDSYWVMIKLQNEADEAEFIMKETI